jgi:hypothetical protein
MDRHTAALELLSVRFGWTGSRRALFSKAATECLKRASQAETAGFREDSESLVEISEYFRNRAGLKPGQVMPLFPRKYR